jgi:hypothetical protein
MEASALLMLQVVICTWNLSHKKTTILSKYKLGFSRRYLQRASSMGSVILCHRPTRVGGALTLPRRQRLDQMFVIERLLHLAALAILDIVSLLLYIMLRMNSSIEGGSFGTILPCGLADS